MRCQDGSYCSSVFRNQRSVRVPGELDQSLGLPLQAAGDRRSGSWGWGEVMKAALHCLCWPQAGQEENLFTGLFVPSSTPGCSVRAGGGGAAGSWGAGDPVGHAEILAALETEPASDPREAPSLCSGPANAHCGFAPSY